METDIDISIRMRQWMFGIQAGQGSLWTKDLSDDIDPIDGLITYTTLYRSEVVAKLFCAVDGDLRSLPAKLIVTCSHTNESDICMFFTLLMTSTQDIQRMLRDLPSQEPDEHIPPNPIPVFIDCKFGGFELQSEEFHLTETSAIDSTYVFSGPLGPRKCEVRITVSKDEDQGPSHPKSVSGYVFVSPPSPPDDQGIARARPLFPAQNAGNQASRSYAFFPAQSAGDRAGPSSFPFPAQEDKADESSKPFLAQDQSGLSSFPFLAQLDQAGLGSFPFRAQDQGGLSSVPFPAQADLSSVSFTAQPDHAGSSSVTIPAEDQAGDQASPSTED